MSKEKYRYSSSPPGPMDNAVAQRLASKQFSVHFILLSMCTVGSSIQGERNQSKHIRLFMAEGKRKQSLWPDTTDVNLRTRVQ